MTLKRIGWLPPHSFSLPPPPSGTPIQYHPIPFIAKQFKRGGVVAPHSFSILLPATPYLTTPAYATPTPLFPSSLRGVGWLPLHSFSILPPATPPPAILPPATSTSCHPHTCHPTHYHPHLLYCQTAYEGRGGCPFTPQSYLISKSSIFSRAL